VHANLQQQQVMIDIMNEEWEGLMIPAPKSPSGVMLPNLEDLLGKLLIKVKYSAPQAVKEVKAEGDKVQGKDVASPESLTDSSSGDESAYGKQTKTQKPKTKKPKLLGALSAMGVYTRGYHFKGFDTPGES